MAQNEDDSPRNGPKRGEIAPKEPKNGGNNPKMSPERWKITPKRAQKGEGGGGKGPQKEPQNCGKSGKKYIYISPKGGKITPKKRASKSEEKKGKNGLKNGIHLKKKSD